MIWSLWRAGCSIGHIMAEYPALERQQLWAAILFEHRRYGRARLSYMAERKLGRPKSPRPLDWRQMVRLSAEEGAWLEALARERDIPIAILLRHIVREYQEQQGNGWDGHNRRYAQQQQEGKP